MSITCPRTICARGICRAGPLPNCTDTWSASFASSSCANARSQKSNDALSFDTSMSFGHFAFAESGVAVSCGGTVAFMSPKALQKR